MSTTIAQTIEEAGLSKATVTLPAELAGNNAILGNVCAAVGVRGRRLPRELEGRHGARRLAASEPGR